jgi:hypothetical protein
VTVHPVAHLATRTLDPLPRDPDAFLEALDQVTAAHAPDATWWAHLEQADGYAVGRRTPGTGFRFEGTPVNPEHLMDGRVFTPGTELRLGPWDDHIRVWARTHTDPPGDNFPEHLHPHLTPAPRTQLLGGPNVTVEHRDGFTALRHLNGQETIVPDSWPPHDREELVLQVRNYYTADPDTGLVWVADVIAVSYEHARVEVLR